MRTQQERAPDHACAPDVVAGRLGSDAQHGLAADAARNRLLTEGTNELDATVRDGRVQVLRRQFTSPMIVLLAAAGALSLVLGDTVEAVVILGVVLLNAAIGFRQEYRAQTAMASLQVLATPTGNDPACGKPSRPAARATHWSSPSSTGWPAPCPTPARSPTS